MDSEVAVLMSYVSAYLGSMISAILTIIGMWKIFKKAGEKGWKSIIPYYNMYIQCKVSGRKPVRYLLSLILFLVFFCISLVTLGFTIFAIAGSIGTSSSLADNSLIVLGGSFILCTAFSIWYIVEHAKLCGALSRSFGHGGGYAAGLFFLGFIFYMILGFNGDQYIGPNGQPKQQ